MKEHTKILQSQLQQKTVWGMLWGFMEKFSMQLVTFLVGVILARLLSPSDYGLIAMTTIFVAISGTIVDSGFSSALIRKKERSKIDYSTVFDINVVLSIIVGGALCIVSPFIASFYNEPLLTDILILNGLYIFAGSFISVQGVRLQAELRFKERGIVNIIDSLTNGIIAIIFAFCGFGVWSLVLPRFFTIISGGLLYWHFMHWFPGIKFSKKSAKEMFSFGSKLLVSSLLDTVYNNLYSIVIGKKFSASDLGYYSKATSFSNLPSMTITGVLSNVAYPVLSTVQDENERLKSIYRKLIRLSAFVVFPIMIGLAVLAKPFIIVLITEKWECAIIYLQVLCLALMWYPIHALNLNLLQVKGRSDLFLKLEFIKKGLGLLILFLTIPLGILYMCIGLVVHSLIALVINTYYTGKLINLGFIIQVKDLLPSLFYSLLMGGFLYFFSVIFSQSYLLILLLGTVLGLAFYIIISYIFKSSELVYLKNVIQRSMFNKLTL